MDEGTVVKEGKVKLQKREQKWSERRLVVRATSFSLFKNGKDTPSRTVPFAAVTFVGAHAGDANATHCLVVDAADRKYILGCDSQSEAAAWLSHLTHFWKTPDAPLQNLDSKYFGVPLKTALARDEAQASQVPWLVEACIDYVNKYGLESEGIYRLSGSAAEITKMTNDIDNGKRFTFTEGTDVNAVAGLLKSWLRELPEPVILHRFYDVLNAIPAFPETERPTYLRWIIDCLPPPNRALLEYLARHLVKVTEHADANKMKEQNVSLLFGPTLLRLEDETPMQMMHNTGAVCTTVNVIVGDMDKIFGQEPAFPVMRAVRATYDFEAQQDNELSLAEGDVIFVTEHEGEWMNGMSVKGSGLFPENFVELLIDIEGERQKISESKREAESEEAAAAAPPDTAGASPESADTPPPPVITLESSVVSVDKSANDSMSQLSALDDSLNLELLGRDEILKELLALRRMVEDERASRLELEHTVAALSEQVNALKKEGGTEDNK